MSRRLVAITALVALATAAQAQAWRERWTPKPPPATTPAAAAIATANGPSCSAIKPFYFEVGTAAGKVASGSIGGSTYGPSTQLEIASASKIYYGAYVAQRRQGKPDSDDVLGLTMKSGFTDFQQCKPRQSVGQCAAGAQLVMADLGKFAYSGGHDQQHAAGPMGLEKMTRAELAVELNRQLGTDVTFSQPQPAGGITTSASEFATFLRAVMSDRLALGPLLGKFAVPTQGPEASHSPVPEAWHYSFGHWVEDAPGGDGAFSSPGAFGFYPWISADKKAYGLVARKVTGGAWASVKCGRQIRAAFLSGVAR